MEDTEGRESIYEEMGCFSPAPAPPLIAGSRSNSNGSVEIEDLSEFHLSPQDCLQASSSTPLQFHPPPSLPPPCDQFNYNNNNVSFINQIGLNGYQDFIHNSSTTTTTPDLLSLLHLPLPHNIMSSSSASASVMYDPLFHLNFPMQQQSLDQNQNCLLGVEEQIHHAANGIMYYDNNNNNDNDGFVDGGILEFNHGGVGVGGGVKRKGRGVKSRTFPTERERRVHFNDRFSDLKKLIPNPTKNDRASIVGEAIDYIKELLRTIEEFKMLVEKKRQGRFKRHRTNGEDDQDQDQEEEEDTVNYKPKSQDQKNNNNNTSLRCSWLKRKSKVTEVDVRIIDDEVTIKLVQKKKINCLLFTTKVLDQLRLDLHHVAGGQIGEHYSFLFNTKICEGSCVYASGIADTVMEVVEKQYMEAVLPNNGY